MLLLSLKTPGTQMMPYMHEMDMTMMDTSYGSNSPVEEVEASEEVVIEEDIGVTEGQAHQHGDHSTEYWLQVYHPQVVGKI